MNARTPLVAASRKALMALATAGALWATDGCAPERLGDEAVSRRERAQPLQGIEVPGRGDLGPERRAPIERRLLLQEARRRNLTVTERDLDDAVVSLRNRFEDLRSFGAWMHGRGLDEESLFVEIRAAMLAAHARAALVEGVRVTDEEVRQYYDVHRDDLKAPGDVRLRVIAVEDRVAAEEVMAALRRGERFASLARNRSLGIRAGRGGETGWVDPGRLPPPLRDAVGTLRPGEASGPLRRGDGFLVVGLAGRRPPRAASLDEVRTEIERRLLLSRQHEVFQAWLAEQAGDIGRTPSSTRRPR